MNHRHTERTPARAHITRPTKRKFTEKPCDCDPPVNHGPHHRETR
jgi:hypothetical protein